MYAPISGDGGTSRFDLRLMPDGVYLSDGRAIPSRDHPGLSVNNGQSVIDVHEAVDDVEGRLCGVLGVHVEQ